MTPEFIRPTRVNKVSAGFEAHKDRTPPSVNPGTDYPCATGTNVNAVANGVVIAVKRNTSGGTGRYVVVDHGHGWLSEYLHLSRVLVNAGQRVKQGQHIAESGGSGFGREHGYPDHLHISVRHNGKMLSPFGNRDFEALLKGQKKTEKTEGLGL